MTRQEKGYYMVNDFIHPRLGEDVYALAGYYTLLKELRLAHGGKEALCITGICAVEASCCGSRTFHYAIVPGYVVNWKYRVNEEGLPVSEVETVTEEAAKEEIAGIIEEREGILKGDIEFW